MPSGRYTRIEIPKESSNGPGGGGRATGQDTEKTGLRDYIEEHPPKFCSSLMKASKLFICEEMSDGNRETENKRNNRTH